MSAAWATWQAGLPAVLAPLLGLATPAAVAWSGQPRPVTIGPSAQLDVIAMPALGIEDRGLTRDDAGTFEIEGVPITGTLTETLVGQRELVVQVSAWNLHQTLAVSAGAMLDALRSRLAWSSTGRALRALGLEYIRCADPVELDGREDDRNVSRWAMDVFLAFASVEVDSDNPTNWIDEARVASESIRDEGGTPLSSQVDVTIDLTEA